MKKTNFSSKLLAVALCVVLAAGLIPATGFALDSTSNAPLSMALVLDNSFAAYEYNTIGDNSWLDAYAGLMEQTPEGSEFAIVTPDGATSLVGNLSPRQKQGIALSELLNIYYFLPSWATSNSGGYHINLVKEHQFDTYVYDIAYYNGTYYCRLGDSNAKYLKSTDRA